ncbi:cell division protein FtsZ [Novosphingobium sp. Rr 2-17]|uniref:cell division protein FtsZ n=1 Tax=Novosphingobium sp. Rr 2-17 TaxID=555793 RepID=UPI000269A1B5|nr:cell division protein FtsZ [Novosphingobium sp. Rr 2-17]EIZ79780.1 cell division protein FtsZ [Novosphingobium sp. Rr 2-17]
MSINIGPPAIEELRPRILVIGVGGAGGNAIANMIHAEIEGVDFVVANTDAQALNNAVAETRIQLGPEITQGLGAGARPEVGRAAAEETREEIERLLEGVHMVFIAAGMGGGTGTGAAPIIAEAARAKGVLTVGVVSKPFMFEGTRRMRAAAAGIEELQKHVDTLIVIPNQNLFLVAKADTTFKEAFQLADEVLQQGVRSITDLMIMPGLINLDFADVRSVMGEMGKAMMGTGEGEGPNRALEAAERAIANPLLDGVSMQGAKGVIISIIGGDDMKLLEVDEAANHIRELVDPDANIIWGSAFNPDLQGKIRVSVVATGIEQSAEQAEIASRPLNLGSSRGPIRPPVQAPEPAPTAYAPPPAAPAPQSYEPAPQDVYEPSAELELGAGDEVSPVGNESDSAPGHAAPGHYGNFGGVRGTPQAEPLDAGASAQPAPAPAPPARSQDELSLQGGQPAPAARPRPAAATGSTLFERMTSLSRPRSGAGEPAAEGEEDPASINIPRFLGRQNNQ